MIERICAFIHNFFTADEDKHAGIYTIENGSIELPFLVVGQYFRIIGSALNDGVYLYGDSSELADETFTGYVWAMKVPRAVRDIAVEAEALEAKNKDALNSPFQSENVIGVYSYTKTISYQSGGAKTGVDSWLFGRYGVFGPRLNQYRKLAGG